MIDIESVKQAADLLAICESDTLLKKAASTGGGEYKGACPFCGGQDRFAVEPYANPGRWLCRHCTNGKWQDVIEYIARRDNLDPKKYNDLQEICKRAAGDNLPTSTTRTRRPTAIPAYRPPAADWQARANEIIERCKAALWEPGGQKALEYLKGRGFEPKTIAEFNLGYSTGQNIADLWVPGGIVIPCIVAGVVWYLKVRLLPAGQQKYQCVRGSRTAAIFNADNLQDSMALFCEGEFDCMIAHQEIFAEIPAVTFGSATNLPDLATWGPYLWPIKTIFSAYDQDKQGESGATRLMDLAGDRVKIIQLPAGVKDINDYFTKGGDLWELIEPYITKQEDKNENKQKEL